jgi:hypothetical protein
MAVNETKTFDNRLEIPAEQWQCKPLTACANKQRNDAVTYAVNDLERHLGEFREETFVQNKEKSLVNESSGPCAPGLCRWKRLRAAMIRITKCPK